MNEVREKLVVEARRLQANARLSRIGVRGAKSLPSLLLLLVSL